MTSSESVNQFSSFRCDFKVVDTEIKHKLIIPIRNESTTISEVLNSVKKDILNKFGITENCDIIHSEQGEAGHPIQYSQLPAHTIFKQSDVFYIRPIVSEETAAHEGHECPVCYGSISQRNVPHARFFQCEHTMCANCHSHLRNRICPICRAPSRPEYELGYEPDFQPDPENDTEENIRENEIDNEDMNQLIYNNQYYRYFHNNNTVNDNIHNNINNNIENNIFNNIEIDFVN